MDIKKLAAEGRMEEIQRQLMDLDSKFSFECQRCGKCCTHQHTILFNSRDIFNIARKLQMTTKEVIDKYAEVYIASSSKIPVIHMVPRGKNEACPFLKDGLCSIHDCKPTICALFPLERVVINRINRTALEGGLEGSELEYEVKYMLNDTDCGSRERVNTVREWLARSGVPEQDEFFLLWNKLTIMLHGMISNLEKHRASDAALEFFWNLIYLALYRSYDTSKEFLPQFRQAAENLSGLCREAARSLERMESSDSGK